MISCSALCIYFNVTFDLIISFSSTHEPPEVSSRTLVWETALGKHAKSVTHPSVCSLAGQSGLIPFYRSDKQLTEARNAGHEYIRYPPLPSPQTTKNKNKAINGCSSYTSLHTAQFASFHKATDGFHKCSKPNDVNLTIHWDQI